MEKRNWEDKGRKREVVNCIQGEKTILAACFSEPGKKEDHRLQNGKQCPDKQWAYPVDDSDDGRDKVVKGRGKK